MPEGIFPSALNSPTMQDLPGFALRGNWRGADQTRPGRGPWFTPTATTQHNSLAAGLDGGEMPEGKPAAKSPASPAPLGAAAKSLSGSGSGSETSMRESGGEEERERQSGGSDAKSSRSGSLPQPAKSREPSKRASGGEENHEGQSAKSSKSGPLSPAKSDKARMRLSKRHLWNSSASNGAFPETMALKSSAIDAAMKTGVQHVRVRASLTRAHAGLRLPMRLTFAGHPHFACTRLSGRV